MWKNKMGQEEMESVQNEISIMKTLDHPNVVSLIETYESEVHYCLVMELMQGNDLYERLCIKGSFGEKEVHAMMVPVFDAVIYCHSQGIVHRDIKLENLLLCDKTEDSIVKISDFGLARHFSVHDLCSTTSGSPGYVAPEIISD